jgi:hypothetical protein
LLNNDVDPIVRRARSKTVEALALRRGASDRALYDGFAALDRERPDIDSKQGGKRQRLDRRERRPRRQRHAVPLVACFTTDRWDNTVGVCDRFDARLDDGALGSFHDSRRVLQFLQWAVPSPLARVTQAERHDLRLAVSSAAGSEPTIEGGSVRALFEQRLLRLASGFDAAFVALLAGHVPLVHDATLALRLVDRFGKPLCRFNEPALFGAPRAGLDRNRGSDPDPVRSEADFARPIPIRSDPILWRQRCQISKFFAFRS